MAKKRRKDEVISNTKPEIVKHKGLVSLKDWPWDKQPSPQFKHDGDIFLFCAGVLFIVTILVSMGWLMYWL